MTQEGTRLHCLLFPSTFHHAHRLWITKGWNQMNKVHSCPRPKDVSSWFLLLSPTKPTLLWEANQWNQCPLTPHMELAFLLFPTPKQHDMYGSDNDRSLLECDTSSRWVYYLKHWTFMLETHIAFGTSSKQQLKLGKERGKMKKINFIN